MGEPRLAHSIAMKACYMSDGSIVIKCDCTVEFKFPGADDFDRIVRPNLISETMVSHVNTTHLPKDENVSRSLMQKIIDRILNSMVKDKDDRSPLSVEFKFPGDD